MNAGAAGPVANARRAAIAGALMMVAATFFFTSLDAILKYLAARHDVVFLTFGRNLFQAAFLMALMPVFGLRRMVATRHPFIHLARGVMLFATTVFVVLSLRALPMAQTYSITFVAPLIAVVLATIFLGERTSIFRWLCIGTGFCGILIAMRPGTSGADWHLLLPLGMATCNAGFHVLTRAIAADEDPMAMLFLVALIAMGLAALSLPWTYSAMTASEWGLLAIGGGFGTLAHLLLIKAFRIAPTSVVSPMIYSQIISAGLIGYFAFGEVATLSTLIGATIVAGSGIALLRAPR